MGLPNKNRVEWMVFGLSLLLVIGAVGALVVDAARTGTASPRFLIELGSVERCADQLCIPVSVTNVGDRMAEDIVVEVTLERAGEPETAELMLPRLARREKGEGSVLFPLSPGEPEQLTAAVRSYSEP